MAQPVSARLPTYRAARWAGAVILALLVGAAPAPGSTPEGHPAADVDDLIDRSLNHAMDSSSHDAAESLARQALTLARERGEARPQVHALLHLGYLFYRWSVLDSALHYNQQALELSQEAGYQHGVGRSLNRLGSAHWMRDEQVEAKARFEEARAVHESLGDPMEIGRSLNNLATVYREWDEYQRAIQLYLEARHQYDRAEYDEGAAWLDFSLAILHKKLGDHDRALESVNSALATYQELATESGDSNGVMICYGQLGDLNTLMGHPELGLKYHLRALEMRQATGVAPAIADGLTGVAKSYYALGEMEQALAYFERSHAVRQAAGTTRGTPTNLKFMGAIQRDMGNPEQALVHLEQALAAARELKERATESELLATIADVHAEGERYRQAWSALKEHRTVGDQVMNAEISKRIATVQFQREIEAREGENERLQRENRIMELQLQSSRGRSILLGVLAAFAVAVAGGAVYLQRKQRQIRVLRGLIPICSHCKKIRNDQGYYERLEEYITAHSEAQFSHGICEECAREHYGYVPKKKEETGHGV